jgi:hypothetical protein
MPAGWWGIINAMMQTAGNAEIGISSMAVPSLIEEDELVAHARANTSRRT